MSERTKYTISVSIDDKYAEHAPLWRVLGNIAALQEPNAPMGIGWNPEKYNRDVSIMVSSNGTITHRIYPEGEESIIVAIGSWSISYV